MCQWVESDPVSEDAGAALSGLDRVNSVHVCTSIIQERERERERERDH